MKIAKYFDKQLQRECWRLDVTVSGQRFRVGKFATRRAAETAAASLRLQAQSYRFGLPSPLAPVSLRELFDEARRRDLRPAQLYALAILEDAINPHKPVTELKRVDMAAFLDAMKQRDLKPGTIAHYKQALYGLLNRAGEWFAELNDWHPPKFPRLQKAEPRQRVLTVDELARLFAAWQRPEPYPRESAKWRDYRLELFDLARLMLLTGARREELESLTINAIDWRTRWLNLRSGKTGRWHAIPLSDESMAVLKSRADCQPMFRRFAPSQIHYICQRVGHAAEVITGREQLHGWTLHDLRRTAASHLESNGIAYSAVSATLGHKRRDITAVYTPAKISEMRRAAELLETLWREIDGILCKQWKQWKTQTGK